MALSGRRPSPGAPHPTATVPAVSTVLAGLTPEQRHAVLADNEVLCVLAGPGSGKTMVLARRVARRVLDGSMTGERTAVVTFTRKAASELRHRLMALDVPGPVWAGTFHGAALAHLRRHWAERGASPWGVLDDPRRVLRRVGGDAVADPAVTAALAAEIHWAQVRMVAPAAYEAAAGAARRRPPGELRADQVADLYLRYREEKARRRVVDLDDLVTASAEVLESDPEARALQHWRTRHVFVDEFQDVNPAQWRLLMAWMGERRDLFVVGDPHQAVYSWNGADPALLDRLPELIPDTVVVRLEDNHRCTPQIGAVARKVLRRPAHRGRERRPDGPPPVMKGFDDDDAEAAAVERWLRLAHRPGRAWSQLAVLARTHARLEPITRALTRAGIPCRHAGIPDGAPGHRPRPGDAAAFLAELRRIRRTTPLRTALAELVVVEPTVDPAQPDADPTQADRDVTYGDPDGRQALQDIARLADEHALDVRGATVGDFLAWLASDGVADIGRAARNAVTVSTFHRAKGLQWHAVAVVGLEDGLVPIAYAEDDAARAEERRLLYVAVTRAEEELWCSWAHERRVGERSWRCEPSPFLVPLLADDGTGLGLVAESEPAAAVRHIARLRAQLVGSSS